MKASKKAVIVVFVILVVIIGGAVAFATNTPTAKLERQLNLGNKYLLEEKYQEAILAFHELIEIDPKNIPARLGLGEAYVATNEFAKAETVLKEVIGLEPKNIPAREILFKVCVTEGNLDAAKAVLIEMKTFDPEKDTKQFNLDLESAIAIDASKANYDLGIQQMNNKQYLESTASFQKVIKEDTKRYTDAQAKISDCKKAFVDATLQKAKDLALNKDYQAALDLLDQILKVDPNNQDALKLKSDYNKAIMDKKAIEEKVTDDPLGERRIPSLEAAIQLVKERVYKDNGDLGYYSMGGDTFLYNGVECYEVKVFSKEMRANGGTGTVDLLRVEVNTGRIWSGNTDVTNGY